MSEYLFYQTLKLIIKLKYLRQFGSGKETDKQTRGKNNLETSMHIRAFHYDKYDTGE